MKLKNCITIALFLSAVIILLGVVFTPIVLASISLYWLFLYLLYFIVITVVIVVLALKFGYVDEAAGKAKATRREGDRE